MGADGRNPVGPLDELVVGVRPVIHPPERDRQGESEKQHQVRPDADGRLVLLWNQQENEHARQGRKQQNAQVMLLHIKSRSWPPASRSAPPSLERSSFPCRAVLWANLGRHPISTGNTPGTAPCRSQ